MRKARHTKLVVTAALCIYDARDSPATPLCCSSDISSMSSVKWCVYMKACSNNFNTSTDTATTTVTASLVAHSDLPSTSILHCGSLGRAKT
eukprot:5031-Heterococcus_DN1.PRE.4